MKAFVLFEDNDNIDPDIEWGISGELNMLGVFSNMEKLKSHLKKLYHENHPDKPIPETTDKLTEKNRLGFSRYIIRTVIIDKPKTQNVTSWWYEE